MYGNILVPITKDSGIRIIVDFLGNFLDPGGEITLLHVITSDKLPISAVQWRRAMGVISEAQALSVERGLGIDFLVKNAPSVVQGILKEASEAKYDLVFFASSTYGKRMESIFGSKIDEVVRKCATDTVVFRYEEGRPAKYSRILVPTSGYKNALRAVRMAEVLAAQSEGEVDVLYVGPD